MNSLPQLQQALFSDFGLILAGLIICRYTKLDRQVWDGVEKLVYYVLFPMLLLRSILQSPLDLSSSAPFIAAALALAAVLIALTYALPHIPIFNRHFDLRQWAASAQIGFRFNSILVFSLCQTLGGPPAVQLAALILGFCVPVFNVAAVYPMAKHADLGLRRELLSNPLVIATVSGLTLNLLGFHIPAWLDPTVQRVGQSTIALGLLCVGAGMQFSALFNAKTLTVTVLSIRHFIAPLTAALLATVLKLNPLQTLVLMVFSASPTASSCYVLATRMGYAGGLVASQVTLSTLLCWGSFSLAMWLI